MAVTAALPQQNADLLIVNARVRTMNPKQPLAEAVAVSGDRITLVGTNVAVRKRADSSTKVIDAGGRLVLPGFNDAHVHFTGVGNFFSHLDATTIDSFEQLREKIAHFTRYLPKGRWLIGAKLDISKFSRSMIAEIDPVSRENPILIYLNDPSSALVNSAALRAAGIQPATAGRGIITGADLVRIRNAIPKDHGSNWSEIVEAASNYAAANGVTSVQDVHSDDLLATYREMARAGRLKTRIYDCIGLGPWEKANFPKPTTSTSDAMVRGGCVKWMADGSEGEVEELTQKLVRADRAGLQIAVHAIGRDAIENTVQAFEGVIKANGKRDRRLRIEHATRLGKPDAQRLTRSNIVLSMQPHLFDRGNSAAGDDYRFLFRNGVRLAFGSDSSMIDINPLLGIHSAVNAGPRSIAVEAAVSAYTLGSAYAEFQESEKGSITVGKLADLVILSDDIFAIDPKRIRDTKSVMTILGGKVVFDAANN